jgi:hypothetical protein
MIAHKESFRSGRGLNILAGLNVNDDFHDVPVYTHSAILVPTSLSSKYPFMGLTKGREIITAFLLLRCSNCF